MGSVKASGSAKAIARSALAVALVLASGTAAALGLGQIEVKSRAGQPLVAEIPIISSDPAELEGLLVGPASPETFARIGLAPPQGIVADLRFMVALDNAGNPIIRVTSDQPVTQPLLTFLVEVESVQGRLVREYSALVDTPQTVAAPLQPPVEAPLVSAPNVIERPAQVPAEPLAQEPAEATPAEETIAANEIPPSPDAAPEPAASAPAPVAAVPEPAFSPSPDTGAIAGDITVARGDTLSELAGGLGLQGMSLDQAMIALLRANPDAFIGGNINRLKQGAVLRIPAGEEFDAVDAGEASALVRSQVRQWRQASQPVPQPAASEAAGVQPAVAQREVTTATTGSADTAPRSASARLEIVPPGARQATQAGNQSGMSAGGEGEMLRQDMETRETLAAREAEVQDLKARVAELEQLQQSQQQLIAMKDTELAAAQQRLAESNQAAPAATAQPAEAAASLLPWALGGGGVLLLALLGGWWLRRRAARAPQFRPPVEPVAPSPLAAAFAASPAGLDPAPEPAPEPESRTNYLFPEIVDPASAAEPTAEAQPAAVTAPVVNSAAQWNRRESRAAQASRGVETAAAPAWHTLDTVAKGAGGNNAQLELARAYIDLGDRDSARQLLGEVVLHGDLESRQHAARMLRDLE